MLLTILYLISICFVPVFIASIFISLNVNRSFKKYSQVTSKKGLPAHVVARQILDSEGLTDIKIGRVVGKLTDHYDPRSKTVVLSDSVYDSCSIAAIGVATHEVGHAIQHAKNYVPIKIRSALVPVLNLGSKLLVPLLIINVFLTILLLNSNVPIYIFYALLAVYGVNMIFSLVTLPCEFNASSRAKDILLDMHIMDDEEVACVGKVLNAAAMTYVAAFIMTLIQFARILFVILSHSRRR